MPLMATQVQISSPDPSAQPPAQPGQALEGLVAGVGGDHAQGGHGQAPAPDGEGQGVGSGEQVHGGDLIC